jgi:DHA1 family bicyclomycin/chloramphenicol resistance-like MFS transporter
MSSSKILGILILAFIAFAVETDVYVPSFPDMLRAYQVSESEIQKILSLNFLGVCLSCLFSGPLSDSFGRKRILSLGTGLFTLSSLVCFLSQNFDVVLWARFIQGLGAGTILAVSGSCVFDLYAPEKSGQLIAILNAVVTMGMAAAPILGVWINTRLGWKFSFLFILILATLSWALIVLFLPETLPIEKRQPFHLKTIFLNYLNLVRNRGYILRSLVWSFMFTCLIVYTANSSLLFLEHLKVSPVSFGFYQSMTSGTFGVFSLICSYAIGKFGNAKVRKAGTLLFFAGMMGLVLVNQFAPSSAILIGASMGTLSAGTALAIVVYFTDSLVGVATAGAAVSLVQALRLFLSSECTDLSRLVFDGSLGSIVLVLFIISLGIAALLLLLPQTYSSLSSDREEVRAIL